MKKICFICSSGGHLSELNMISDISDGYHSFLITEKVNNYSNNKFEKIYFAKQINRKQKLFIFSFVKLFVLELFWFLKERPDFVVTTGALISYPMIKIAKFFRKKTVYIESYARVFDLSTTGKKLYDKVDLFLVQWPELAEKYPKTEYCGNVFWGE